MRERVASRSNVLTTSAVSKDLSLLFNGLSGALLELSPEETRQLGPWVTSPDAPVPSSVPDKLLDRLVNGGFVVPQGFDEVRALRELRETRADDHLMLTVAPTMQCNFRCTYCFEEHSNSYMSLETEEQLQRFVMQNLRGKKYFTVTWFGGEPLLHMDCLVRLQTFFKEASKKMGVALNTSLVTNGHLMTREVIERLKSVGPFKSVQVTIDGTAQMHDTRRPLVSGRGSWETIVKNSRLAIEASLPLSVRMNIDNRNGDILEAAVDALIEAKVLPTAWVYLGSVSDSTEACAHVEDHVLSRQEFARLRLRLSGILLERGLDAPEVLPRSRCSNLCIADNDSGFVIGPSGAIFKCWNQVHMSDEHAVGHLDGRHLVFAEQNDDLWRNYDPLNKSGCQSCFALATCMGGCPWENMRLHAEEVGSCGDFKFFPDQILRLAHLSMAEKALAREAAESERLD